MKSVIIIVFCSLILASCSNNHNQSKVYYENRSRMFRIQSDSVIKKIQEFAKQNKTTIKALAVTPEVVFIEESLNSEQSLKYANYDNNNDNIKVIGSEERLLIYINPDSLKTGVRIKSFLTGTISYLRFYAKSVERVEENVNFASTGVRENEILNFIGGGVSM